MKTLIVTKDFKNYKKGDFFKDPQGKRFFESEKKAQLYASSYPQLKLMDLPEGFNQETHVVVHTEAQPEKWTKAGVEDKLEQPTVTYWEKDGIKVYEEPTDSTGYTIGTEPDTSYTYVEAIPESFSIEEDQAKVTEKRQAKANANLDQLRSIRKSKIEEADFMVFKAEDNQEDSTALRDYRKALRAVTDSYKKADGYAKLAAETLDVESFTWPVKP